MAEAAWLAELEQEMVLGDEVPLVAGGVAAAARAPLAQVLLSGATGYVGCFVLVCVRPLAFFRGLAAEVQCDVLPQQQWLTVALVHSSCCVLQQLWRWQGALLREALLREALETTRIVCPVRAGSDELVTAIT